MIYWVNNHEFMKNLNMNDDKFLLEFSLEKDWIFFKIDTVQSRSDPAFEKDPNPIRKSGFKSGSELKQIQILNTLNLIICSDEARPKSKSGCIGTKIT